MIAQVEHVKAYAADVNKCKRGEGAEEREYAVELLREGKGAEMVQQAFDFEIDCLTGAEDFGGEDGADGCVPEIDAVG